MMMMIWCYKDFGFLEGLGFLLVWSFYKDLAICRDYSRAFGLSIGLGFSVGLVG